MPYYVFIIFPNVTVLFCGREEDSLWNKESGQRKNRHRSGRGGKVEREDEKEKREGEKA